MIRPEFKHLLLSFATAIAVVLPLRYSLDRAMLPRTTAHSELRFWSSLPIDAAFSGTPQLSANGNRALLQVLNPPAAALYERGAGVTVLSPEGVVLAGSGALSSDGSTAAFFAGRAGAASSLYVWREGSGTLAVLSETFSGEWDAALSPDGRVLLATPRASAVLSHHVAGLENYGGGIIRLRLEGPSDTLIADELPIRGALAASAEKHQVHAATVSSVASAATGRQAAADDFDGDGASDLLLFESDERSGMFRVLTALGFDGPAPNKTTAIGRSLSVPFPPGGAVPVPGDYDGDGAADFATYVPRFSPSFAAPTNWRVVLSRPTLIAAGRDDAVEPVAREYSWGIGAYVAVPGDYDGDRRHDLAVFDPVRAVWLIAFSGGGFDLAKAGLRAPGYGEEIQWGLPGDVPVPGDYDGDGKAEPAVVRTSGTGQLEWYISTRGIEPIVFGKTGETAIPADYDGDGKIDPAVVSPEAWRVRDGRQVISHEPCPAGYEPVARDFDADRRADIACYGATQRPAWIVRLSSVTDHGRRLFADKGPGIWYPDFTGNGTEPAEVVLRRHQRP